MYSQYTTFGALILIGLVVFHLIQFASSPWTLPSVTLLHDKNNASGGSVPPKYEFPSSELKPADQQYSRTIVMGKIAEEDVKWIDEELGDLLYPNGPYKTVIYSVDNRTAALHTAANKGHEALVYLTYIIDNYDNLADITLFTHPSRSAWHNNWIQDFDLTKMIRYLRPETVLEEGYVNLRIDWEPGCPAGWIDLKGPPFDSERPEQGLLYYHWSELFPFDQRPQGVGQACCSQFAITRERIRAIPITQYHYLRGWLLATPAKDSHSGRVFEYVWQYLWTREAVHCPVVFHAYCSVYGICFESQEQFDHLEALLQEEKDSNSKFNEERAKAENHSPDAPAEGVMTEDELDTLDKRLQSIRAEMATLKVEAYERGKLLENP